MIHRFHESCEDMRCYVCENKLAYCDTCHCGEGTLLTFCPGGIVGTDDQNAIMAGKVVDFPRRKNLILQKFSTDGLASHEILEVMMRLSKVITENPKEGE